MGKTLNIEDFQKEKEDFKRVLEYSQGVSVNIDTIFEEWLKNKVDFYNLFGQKLIYEIPNIDFSVEDSVLESKFNDFTDMVYSNFINPNLYDFLMEEGYKSFFNNELEKPYKISKEKTLPAGMKMLKAFKFFENDLTTLEMLQTKASMVLQTQKISGTLCFSIHPLDYLSSSENKYNWRSCHSLDGEYRSGNLSYMQDSSTIICYLKGDSPVYLDNFPSDLPWNNKKWRMLLFFSDAKNCLAAGRQYPFFTLEALNIVRDKILPLTHRNWSKYNYEWSKWHNDHIQQYEYQEPDCNVSSSLAHDYLVLKRQIVKNTDVIFDAPHSTHYDDLLYSSCYKPYFCWDNYSFRDIQFHIGSPVPCIHCGEENVTTGDTMMCLDCELEYGQSDSDDYFTCDCCGSRGLYDESYYIESTGETVCVDCFEEHYGRCENCGEYYPKSELIYDKYNEGWFCPNCL